MCVKFLDRRYDSIKILNCFIQTGGKLFILKSKKQQLRHANINV